LNGVGLKCHIRKGIPIDDVGIFWVCLPKSPITNELKTIGEYGCSNQLQEFQLTSWLEVGPFFPDEYPRCLDGNLNID
jgi:hypothetical protein